MGRPYRPPVAFALALAVCGSIPLVTAAQSATAAPKAAASKPWTAPRTPDGRPDLQGTWDFRTATPLERPREFADREFFTDEEAARFERQEAERIDATIAVHPPFWLDYGKKVLGDKRTSLIVDPPDGRIPARTPEAQRRLAARAADRRGPPDGPEDFTLVERCLVFSAGPPITPGPYNNNLQIVQTRDAVVLSTEMIHDARIVTLDGRPHVPSAIHSLLGDSRGRWDRDTLVVETTNFDERVSFRGSDEHLRVSERFWLSTPDTLMYEFTVDDPTAFTRSWTARTAMTRTDDHIYEYACHEGNYGLLNILRGARFDERTSTHDLPEALR